MVKQIASRAAGLRLSFIVAVLMIPVIVLGAFMLQSIQRERSVLKREIQGVQFSRLVMPVMLGALRSKTSPDEEQLLKDQGDVLAEELDVGPIFTGLMQSLAAKDRNYSQVLRDTRQLLALSSETSGLILDSDAESYHMAIVATVEIPDTIENFKNLQIFSFHAMSTMRLKNNRLLEFFLSVGRFSESIDRLAGSISRGKIYSANKEEYQSLETLVQEFGQHIGIAKSMLQQTNNDQLQVNIVKAGEFGRITSHIADDLNNMWTQSSQLLLDRLYDRVSLATRNMISLGAIALLTSIIGIGYAAAMFKSTLKQLDTVVAARRLADVARDAAEDMSEKLIVINADMARLNRDLESNMKKLTEAQAEIVRKTKFANLGQLTATVAHELRNPLGAVRTSAFLLERKLKDKGMGVEAQLLRINNGITRCDETITQLLDFSRSKQINCHPADLDSWLIEIIEEEARKLPPSVNITCTLGLGSELVPIDKARLQRAIVNTIANASEAMVGKGEITVGDMTTDPTITVETKRTDDFVEIAISDNGPGIATENLQKIREPMFTTKNFGTGLGIPAIEQILEQHNGTLDITSELGHGAKFVMRIPLVHIREDAA